MIIRFLFLSAVLFAVTITMPLCAMETLDPSPKMDDLKFVTGINEQLQMHIPEMLKAVKQAQEEKNSQILCHYLMGFCQSFCTIDDCIAQELIDIGAAFLNICLIRAGTSLVTIKDDFEGCCGFKHKWTILHHVASNIDFKDVFMLCFAASKDWEDFFVKDYYGRTPLHLAAQKGNHEIVSLMLENMPKNIAWRLIRNKDRFKKTAIHMCIQDVSDNNFGERLLQTLNILGLHLRGADEYDEEF